MSKQPEPKTVGKLLADLKKIQEWHLVASTHSSLPKKQQAAHKVASETIGESIKLVLNMKEPK